MKKLIKLLRNYSFIVKLYNLYLRSLYSHNGFKISYQKNYISIKQNKYKELRIPKKNYIYLKDTLENFNFYFDAVEPEIIDGFKLVDYSQTKVHWVKGFNKFQIEFPSVAEPAQTIDQYIEFAGFRAGSVVFDIGAYSGLTSILFDLAIENGRVIAIEADAANIPSCKNNFSEYKKFNSRTIELIEAAVWENQDGVMFSSEGSMGSSAIDIVGHGRGNISKVPTVTLKQIAKQRRLSKVDFIKCDIEGGELNIFDDKEFFESFSPKIIIECHYVDGKLTFEKCKEILEKFGYYCEMHIQDIYPLPLLFATRKTADLSP